ncbi:MAG TPA: DUF3301 domain-containing protein [Aromatoleum sp.]|uniref:DUF3301 domain-containing protein n=1 Tax=Aromatoleum sp. TaxID=2307007 RepID=UPI002B4A6373|nr:DUF3301 domain-containing protein [Aromatoleum sp.]HJV24274.1 DUF3301 domain-containing protein [Aromatoleum sp.]
MSFWELLSVMALVLVGWYWLDSIRTREIGVQAAKAACQREGVQLLDDTVATRSLRIARDDNGRACLQRVYEFEYSNSGNDRQAGSVMLRGREVVMLDIGPRASNVVSLH